MLAPGSPAGRGPEASAASYSHGVQRSATAPLHLQSKPWILVVRNDVASNGTCRALFRVVAAVRHARKLLPRRTTSNTSPTLAGQSDKLRKPNQAGRPSHHRTFCAPENRRMSVLSVPNCDSMALSRGIGRHGRYFIEHWYHAARA